MTSLRTLAEWSLVLIYPHIIGFFAYPFVFGTGSSAQPSGLPDTTGGFSQDQLSPPQQFTKTTGDWQFTFASEYTYTLAR